MEIEHWDIFEDGPLTEPALRKKIESLGYKVTRYSYPPGMYFGPHRHEVDKIDAVLSGYFRITMGADSEVLEPGDYVFVPRGVEHSAEAVGESPVVSLDAIKGEQ